MNPRLARDIFVGTMDHIVSNYTNRRTDEYGGDLHTRLAENLEGL